MKTKEFHYDAFAKTLHWILAILIISMLFLGFYMVSIAELPGSGGYFKLHKSIGIVVGVLVLLRLLWRLFHKPAPLPASVPFWQVTAAHTVHWLLYASVVIMPLTGFIGSALGKSGVSFFGYPINLGLAKNKELSDWLFDVHILFAWILAFLVTLHILAAFVHLFKQDKVFERMV